MACHPGLWLALAVCGFASDDVRTTPFADPDTLPGYHCWEPHVAIDPADPDRVAVTAMYRGVIGKGENARGDGRLFVWRSADGGRSWSAPAAPFVGPNRPAGRIGADPVVAFGTDRTCWLAGCDYDFPVGGRPGYSSIKVARSAEGKPWGPPITCTELDNATTGKGLVDKPWLAVDAGKGSRRGTVYVAWTRFDYGPTPNRSDLWCAAIPPGADRPNPGVRLGPPADLKGQPNAVHQVQLAVRPDGTLDAVWQRAGRLTHAFSSDGGKTFSDLAAVADGTGQFPSLTATPDGKLFAAWGDGGAVSGSVFAAGKWSPPGPVSDGVRHSHPAVAATADALWVLAYRRGATAGVSVVLYRSTDGRAWAEYRVLASRESNRTASPGDYIGLAGAKGRLYAAYVLPDDGSKPRLFASRIDPPAGK